MEIQLAIDLYRKLGNLNKYTVDSWVSQIHSIKDPISFLVYNNMNYVSTYFRDVLLSFEFLLFRFSAEDWRTILLKNTSRKEIILGDSRPISEDQTFGDIIFLHKYLNINPFSVLKELFPSSNSDLINCVKFSNTFSWKFFIEPNELLEDLSDFYNVTKKELDEYSEKLISQGFERGFKNEDEMIKYLDEMIV